MTPPGIRLAGESESERLRKALASLQPDDFALLIMRHVDQITIPEIALELEVTERAVKYRLLRALIRLRESMES